MLVRYSIAVVLLAAVAGCGEPACPEGMDCEPVDAGADGDTLPDATVTLCAADRDCSDGDFCTGAERCIIGDPAADARGCVLGTPPCLAEQICDSAMGRCVTDCSVGDADGDGERAIECGGNDCDDSDSGRFPGNPEICDDRDQDCVDETLAPASGDGDGDGFVSNLCCAPGEGGPVCGRDCDDGAGGVNPGSPEACNGVDDDCDGLTDEGLTSVFYRDEDGDLYGLESDSVVACVRPAGYATVPGDCDDEDRMINPLGTETCDGVDQDCDSRTDEEAAELGAREHCGACFNECQFACGGVSCDLPVDVQVGRAHACALLASGAVYCWGANDAGQLGDGTFAERARPTAVTGGLVADGVAVGSDHTCVTEAGEVYCFGANGSRQLGTFDGSNRNTPTIATSSAGVPPMGQISAGAAHTCAVEAGGGRVYCWGDGEASGHGSETSRPAPVLGVVDVSEVRAGGGTCVRLQTLGRARCWGNNTSGQLGTGSTSPSEAPGGALVAGVLDVAALSVGSEHACAVTAAGDLYCWGSNTFGQIGSGATGDDVLVPMLVGGGYEIAFAGHRQTCATTNDADGRCWGFADIGDGTPMSRPSPTGLADVTMVSVVAPPQGRGSQNSCAVADGVVYCWGSAGSVLGLGPGAGRTLRPTRVLSPSE